MLDLRWISPSGDFSGSAHAQSPPLPGTFDSPGLSGGSTVNLPPFGEAVSLVESPDSFTTLGPSTGPPVPGSLLPMDEHGKLFGAIPLIEPHVTISVFGVPPSLGDQSGNPDAFWASALEAFVEQS